MDKKALSILSLCSRAGKLVSGEFACEKALSEGIAKLVIISTDASDNTRKKFVNKAFYYKVPVVEYSEREAMSSAIGRPNRVTIVITDMSFAENMKKYGRELL